MTVSLTLLGFTGNYFTGPTVKSLTMSPRLRMIDRVVRTEWESFNGTCKAHVAELSKLLARLSSVALLQLCSRSDVRDAVMISWRV